MVYADFIDMIFADPAALYHHVNDARMIWRYHVACAESELWFFSKLARFWASVEGWRFDFVEGDD